MNNTPRIIVSAYLLMFLSIGMPASGEGDEGEAASVAATVDATAEGEVAPAVATEEVAEEPVAAEPAPAVVAEEVAPATEEPVPEAAPAADAAAEPPAVVEPAEVAPVVDGGKTAEGERPAPAPVVQEEQPIPETAPTIAAEKDPEDGTSLPVVAEEEPPKKESRKVPSKTMPTAMTKEVPGSVIEEKDQTDLMSTPAVVTVMQKKELQLVEAKAEIARLKDIIKKIAEANRRERAAMHYNLGCAYKAAGDPRKAEAELLKAVELDPHDAITHYNLGILYDDDLKDKKKAKEHYEKYLLLAPNSKDAPSVLEWMKSL